MQGRVIDGVTKEPLDGARAFISSTTYQTITNSSGHFYLQMPAGSYQLAVTYVGYGSKIVNSQLLPDRQTIYTIELFPEIESLQSVSVLTAKDRENFERLFKNLFLGVSKNASNAKILNIKDVYFHFDKDNGILEANCNVPIIIENPNLNYQITFLLSHFIYNLNTHISSFVGYPTYGDLEQLSGSALKKITKNRETAYRGSAMHWIRAIYHSSTEDEGFQIKKFKQVLNPQFPGDEIHDKMVAEARKSKDYSLLMKMPKKHLTQWGARNVYARDIVIEEGEKKFLYIHDFLDITYYRESPESKYYGNITHQAGIPNYQNSQLQSHKQGIEIYANGTISDPDALIYFGYIGWEKVADMLPFDYKVETD